MEPSGTNPVLSDQELSSRVSNRRRRVRHAASLPAFVQWNPTSTHSSPGVDSIRDISEDGISFRSVAPLDIGSSVELGLDLYGGNAPLRLTGRLAWSNGSGLAGIQFSPLPAASLSLLKQWLFLNLLVRCASLAGSPEMLEHQSVAPDTAARSTQSQFAHGDEFQPALRDYTSTLTALVAVRREVEGRGSDLNAALQLLAERAQAFTPATGAAIAMRQGGASPLEPLELQEFVCQASAGSDAPGLGIRLQAGSGFSGECVRTGKLLVCGDTEIDHRVDRDSCRALGIRSIVAVPIRVGGSVDGLLEVFSSKPNVFGLVDNGVLQQLADISAFAVSASRRNLKTVSQPASAVATVPATKPADMFSPLAGAQAKPKSFFVKLVLFAAVLIALLVLAWLVWPWVKGYAFDQVQMRPQSATSVTARSLRVASNVDRNTVDRNTMEGLRKLAEQGDAAAQFAIGARYATAEDVPQDYAEAVRWFEMAAQQGHVVSQATLGAYYWAGRGIPQDLNQAYFWSILACAGGDEASKYRVEVLSSRLTRSQITAAQLQANEWLKQHPAMSSELAPNPR